MSVEIIQIPAKLIEGLRAWYHPKDRSVILDDNCFIEGQEIVTPPNPIVGRRRLYAKDDCWYDLDSSGTETGFCVTGVDPTGHTHSKLVASDGAPDPALSADASGYLSAAVQPLVSAYNSVTDANVTGDGTVYTIICDTEIIDRNGDYNNATGTFLAPVTGMYLFVVGVDLEQLAAGHTQGYIRLNTSNRSYYPFFGNPINCALGAELILRFPIIADLDAADTATVSVYVAGAGKTVDVASPYTYFQGYLLI